LKLGSTFYPPMTRWPRSLHMTDLVQAATTTACRGRMRNTVVEFAEDERVGWRNFGHAMAELGVTEAKASPIEN
jgi:hypothetical protein